MNRRTVLILIAIIFASLLVYVAFEGFPNDYQKTVRNMQHLSIKEMNSLFKSDKQRLIFVGRDGCSGCDEFAKILLAAYNNDLSSVLYLNTRSSERSEILSYLEQYGINQVPTIMIIGNNKIIFPKVPHSVNEMKRLVDKLGL